MGIVFSTITSVIQSLVTSIYYGTLPTQNALFALRDALVSRLSPRAQRRINFLHDVGMSSINVTFGPIQPSLRPYIRGSPSHLLGKHAIVTGANSGLGLQIAKDLAQQGADVVLAVRNKERGEGAKEEIVQQFPQAKDRVKVMILDTSSLESVRAFVKTWAAQHDQDGKAELDILIHNAGIAASADSAKEYTDDGFQMVYATNFLGSFLLTHLLEQYLSEKARVILTSSTGQYACTFGKEFKLEKVTNSIEPGFHVLEKEKIGRDVGIPNSAYAMSKGMQSAFARALQKKWTGEENQRIAHSFTPGFTSTAIFGKYKVQSLLADPIFGLMQVTTAFAMDVKEGAATGTWLASAPLSSSEALRKGGKYWDRLTCRMCKADLLDDATLDRLWTRWSKDAGIEWH